MMIRLLPVNLLANSLVMRGNKKGLKCEDGEEQEEECFKLGRHCMDYT